MNHLNAVFCEELGSLINLKEEDTLMEKPKVVGFIPAETLRKYKELDMYRKQQYMYRKQLKQSMSDSNTGFTHRPFTILKEVM
jgi:hypothetical protein